MARPLRIQYSGACYHVTCRGNERRRIFADDEDRIRFLELLADSLETYGVVLHAYVLMDNHFHLLLQTTRPNLAEFMRQFNSCYTSRFNSRHDRCGHLYQGRYKAFLIDADAYLLDVSRYVQLNPARTRQARSAPPADRWRLVQEYPWSSLPGYLSERKTEEFVDYGMVLAMAAGRHNYREFLKDGLRADARNPFKEVRRGLILGDLKFEARLKQRMKSAGSRREQPSYRQMVEPTVSFTAILDIVTKVTELDRKSILMRQGDGVARGITSELAHRYGGLTQGGIGELLGGIDYSAVSRLRSRLKQRLVQDKRVREVFEQSELELQGLMSRITRVNRA